MKWPYVNPVTSMPKHLDSGFGVFDFPFHVLIIKLINLKKVDIVKFSKLQTKDTS